MNFDSKTCGSCYKIGNEITDRRLTTGNEVLFESKSQLGNMKVQSLHKQSYSDGTCFYTLQDKLGNWDVSHGSYDIKDLIKQIEYEVKKYSSYKDNDLLQSIYKEITRWNLDIINNLKKLA
jgi:hypothetical protein